MIWKRAKENKKRWVIPITAILLLMITSFQVLATNDEKNDKPVWEREPLKLQVVLQTHYLDGSLEEESKEVTVWSLQDFWAGYKDWKVIEQEEGKVVFRKYVEDLSPTVKQNGYIGINENNVLSIFNGKPVNNEVIKAFYEIDVGKLESYRMDQLKSGIKVDKKSTFKDVMKTYRAYASSEPVND
jgi:forespore regulator of the sigma-K checkpoint